LWFGPGTVFHWAKIGFFGNSIFGASPAESDFEFLLNATVGKVNGLSCEPSDRRVWQMGLIVKQKG
jgi:hypothetical protein